MEKIERNQYFQAANAAAPACGVGTRRKRERAQEVVFVHDRKTGDVIDVFGATFEVFGYYDKYAGSLGVEYLSLGNLPYTVENYLKRLRAAAEGNTPPFLWMARDRVGSSFPVCVTEVLADKNEDNYLLASVRDVSEPEQYEKRIQQLGRVLYAYELIDRLLAQEKNRLGFADSVCEILVEICKYRHAFIILLDEHGLPVGAGESGLTSDFNRLFAMIQNGRLSSCCTKALKQAKPVITRIPSSDCTTCPLELRDYSNAYVITTRLEQENGALGVLSVVALDGHAEESSDLQFIRRIAST